ncbi:MAG: L,D-transpeptidase family protein [Lachnospiraceae bacterium]|nr:L,D-transpeptidase family protein [Lachnospiraceae bacterium]
MRKKLILFFTVWMLTGLMIGSGSMTALAAETTTSTSVTQNGIVTDASGYIYYYLNGVMQTGWRTVGEDIYYFNPGTSSAVPTGAALTGLNQIDGYWYYLRKEGTMRTGWVTINGNKYYFRSATDEELPGAALTGFQQIGKYKYYFNTKGVMQTGWKKVNGYKRYFSKSNGRMKKSTWVKIGSYYYYFNSNGVLKTNCIAGSTSKGFGYVNSKGRRTSVVDSSAGAMISKAKNKTSSTSYLILVNCTTNRVGIFKKSNGAWTLKKYMTCASGAYSSPTVKGTFTVLSKGLCFGSSYTCWYYTQFYGNYLFHSILYQPGSMTQVQESGLGTNASHGCVRLSLSDAKWIYDNIPLGTTVYVY